MKILVLNGSPRPKGNTKAMVTAFAEGAESAGHQVDIVDVCKLHIHGCNACEYCHTKGNGICVQQDDMQKICTQFGDADMLVVASPIYFAGIPGQLKCVVDRFYAVFNPQGSNSSGKSKKFAAILSSAMPGVYGGATAVLKDSLAAGLGLEVVSVLTANGEENGSAAKLAELRNLGKSL